MSAEACTLALKNTLNEIRNVCPDVANAFVFRKSGQVVAVDDGTSEVAVNNAQDAFLALTERANAIGGIESAAINGTTANANLICFDDFCVTTVAAADSDEKTVSNFTRVMIPTTLKLVQNIIPTINTTQPEIAFQKSETLAEQEPIESANVEIEASEFSVENLTGFGGFLNDPETVYVDRALLAQWKENYGDKLVKRILIEAPTTGKNIECRFRPFKDAKYESKGIVQLPDKVQSTLNVQKGTQVLLKPVFQIEEQAAAQKKKDEEVEKPAELPKPDLYGKFEGSGKAPVSQLMVENLRGIGGLVGNPDCVRVESSLIARWDELFGEKVIKEVLIEDTVLGKKIQCKFQAIKDGQLEGKAVIQIPEKIQSALRTKKGALVVVKPVTE